MADAVNGERLSLFWVNLSVEFHAVQQRAELRFGYMGGAHIAVAFHTELYDVS